MHFYFFSIGLRDTLKEIYLRYLYKENALACSKIIGGRDYLYIQYI